VKNITVSVSDELYYEARIRAAELRSSVSALVRRFLQDLVAGDESTVDRLRRERAELIARIREQHPGFSARERLPRDAVHERDALR
jgi:plasmid stability protein